MGPTAAPLLARPLAAPGQLALVGAWALCAAEGESPPPAAADWLPMAQPGPVAAVLRDAGRWPDDGAPLPDLDAKVWWYRCHFDRPGPEARWLLGFDGLATLATVWLNGEPVLVSRNMFQRHVLSLGGDLKPTGNELLIRFDALSQALGQRRPRPRWRVPMLAHQQLRWWRTTLLGRTPGWSPPWAVVGPWRDVWLAPEVPHRCIRYDLRSTLEGEAGRVDLCLGWADDRDLKAARVNLADARGRVVASSDLVRDVEGRWHAGLRAPAVQRWWPHTHGEPVRYALTLHTEGPGAWDGATAIGAVGFRTLALDRQDGGFRCVVNDQAVFARGACWTPQDSLRMQVDRSALRQVLVRLREAGLNMLRVGGTMVYESPDFLDLCDELGILVWQDLMFASMDYPADDAGFLADVGPELDQQWAQWQARPALAVVCGNSEVDQQAAMWGAPREDWSAPWFHRVLPAQMARVLPDTPWWPSSAHAGAFPFQPSEGTCSYYGVGAYRRPLADARTSRVRFASECLAFANIPSDAALARMRSLNQGLPPLPHGPLWKARSPRDLGAGWDFDEVRDHYVSEQFGETLESLRAHDPARHRLLGRTVVAELMRASFDQWRSQDADCAGALVWFLRDLWTGAGWGVLDELGHPKSAFQGLRQAWQPRHLGVVDEGLNGLTLHLVNESAVPLPGASLSVRLWREGSVPVATAERSVSLDARGALSVPLAAMLPDFVDTTWVYRFGPPVADVLVARWRDAAGHLLAERVHFLPGPNRLVRRDLGLSATVESLDEGARALHVRCATAARGLQVETEGWWVDGDHVDLAPDGQVRIVLRPLGPRAAWRVQLHAANALAPWVVPEGLR